MRGGAGGITFVGGALLIAAAWSVGALGLPSLYRPLTTVVAEPLAVLLLVLAWRFRRSRLALAALVIALANLLVRGPAAAAVDVGQGVTLAAHALLLPINLAVITLAPERPVPHRRVALHAAVILLQPWLVAGVPRLLAASGSTLALPASWTGILSSRSTWLLVFLIAGVFSALALVARRGAFEVGALWALVASGLALLAVTSSHRAALMLASAQLVLLFAVVEESYHLAYHDELTGLPGRRALEEALRLLDGEYALAMVDVDRFKGFNDRFGHEAGDQALRMVADELAKVGGGGRAYRYGGEEFAILFPGRSLPDVEEPLERLRARIAARQFALRSPHRPRRRPERPLTPTTVRKVQVTVSIGAAESGAMAADPPQVLKAADAALYRAKRRGRNRLVLEGSRGRLRPQYKKAATQRGGKVREPRPRTD